MHFGHAHRAEADAVARQALSQQRQVGSDDDSDCVVTARCVLLDLNMPGPPAVETVAYLREHCPKVKVVVLTASDDEAGVRSLAGCVAGYVLKSADTEEVVRAIRAVMQGGTWFSQPIVEKLVRLAADAAPPVEEPTLTKRELEVLQLMANGKTDSHIGRALCISVATVRTHVRSILEKLRCVNRTQAAVQVVKKGLWAEIDTRANDSRVIAKEESSAESPKK